MRENNFDHFLKTMQSRSAHDEVMKELNEIPITNADIERLFSYAKHLKTNLQFNLNVENFTRNVFLKLTDNLPFISGYKPTQIIKRATIILDPTNAAEQGENRAPILLK